MNTRIIEVREVFDNFEPVHIDDVLLITGGWTDWAIDREGYTYFVSEDDNEGTVSYVSTGGSLMFTYNGGGGWKPFESIDRITREMLYNIYDYVNVDATLFNELFYHPKDGVVEEVKYLSDEDFIVEDRRHLNGELIRLNDGEEEEDGEMIPFARYGRVKDGNLRLVCSQHWNGIDYSEEYIYFEDGNWESMPANMFNELSGDGFSEVGRLLGATYIYESENGDICDIYCFEKISCE